MRKLVDAGLVEVERRHKWAYYSVSTDALKEITAWLSRAPLSRARRRAAALPKRRRHVVSLGQSGLLRGGRRGRQLWVRCGRAHRSHGNDRLPDIRETVRERYAAAARAVAEQGSSSCCRQIALTDSDEKDVFGGSLYDDAETGGATATAVAASLGCGVPTAVADLHEGETVLDLGSGAGADVLISARRVGPSGQGDRPGHDRRDARARARECRRGRGGERRVRQGLHRGHPARRTGRST